MPIKAIQQFQLRTIIGTYEQAAATLKAVKEAGFGGIELNGFMIKKMPMIVRALTSLAGMPVGRSGRLDWQRLISDSGLKVVGIHEDLGSILKRTSEVIDETKAFGTQNVVVTGMHRFDYSDKATVTGLADRLNTGGKLLKDSGVRLLYHNHNCEFRRVDTGETAFQLLFENTNPDYVNFEYDSYWAQEAGCDTVELMKYIGKRMKLYHINDRGTRKKGSMGSIIKSDSIELGCGNMNLDNLIKTVKENDVEAIILESHRNWVENSPVKSFQISAEFLNSNIK